MSIFTTPRLLLKYLVEGQAGAEISHNDAMNVLDSFTQMMVKSRTTAAQPGSPANGDLYLIPTGATGAIWSLNIGKFALYYSGWLLFTVKEGVRFWVEDENRMAIFDGGGYQDLWIGPPHCQNRRLAQHISNVALTTINSIGQAAPTVVQAAQASGDDADGPSIEYSTSAVANNQIVVQTPAHFRRDWLADAVFRFKTDATLTNIRIFCGFFDAGIGAPLADAPIGDYACFRYSTAADGTLFWRYGTCNNATATFAASTKAIAASTLYVARIRLLAASVEFYLNDVFVVSTPTTLPTATTKLGAVLSCETLNAAVKKIKWSQSIITQL